LICNFPADPDARVYVAEDDENGSLTLTIKEITKADEHAFACSVGGIGISEDITLSVLGN
jgi:hypothetical protein